mgnify:CR=1 FL=1
MGVAVCDRKEGQREVERERESSSLKWSYMMLVIQTRICMARVCRSDHG